MPIAVEPAGTADIKVRDFPRLDESQFAIVINTLGQAAATALGCQSDRAVPSVFLEERGWQISTDNLAVALEFENPFEST